VHIHTKLISCISLTGVCIGSYLHLSAGLPLEDIKRVETAEQGSSEPTSTDSAPNRVSSKPAEADSANADPADAADNKAFDELQSRLASAEASAAELDCYTAVLEMREQLSEGPPPQKSVSVKIRREPFSVYMRWEDSGQEALFVEGENDNRMLVKPTKGLTMLKRMWRLDPDSRMARQSCRYPITDTGVERLAARVNEFYTTRTDWPEVTVCRRSIISVAGTDAVEFDVQFRDQTISPDFSRSRYFFKREDGFLIGLENYDWSGGGQKAELVERYVYHSIDSDVELADEDFDQKNPEYAFVSGPR
jgi:hypothetical protein